MYRISRATGATRRLLVVQDFSYPRLRKLRREKGIKLCYSVPYTKDTNGTKIYDKHKINNLKLQYLNLDEQTDLPVLESISLDSIVIKEELRDGCEKDSALFQGQGSDNQLYSVRVSWGCFSLKGIMPPQEYNVYVHQITRGDGRDILGEATIRMKYQELAPQWD
jgi:hypothetical protein